MEDVFLYYRPGSAAGLRGLLERTEKLLDSFPLRTPPVFTPWSPAAADRHRPIRPARPPPVITACSGTEQNQLQKPEEEPPNRPEPETPQEPNPATPEWLLPQSGASRNKDGVPVPVPDPSPRRSWSVSTQRRGVLLRSSGSLSKSFHQVVSLHRLHLHQRAKWVIARHNWGATRDLEQVWRSLSRRVRSAGPPPCNANVQRERAEIWVFCDVVHSEPVGRFLKEELQLEGRILLSVHRLENIFSM